VAREVLRKQLWPHVDDSGAAYSRGRYFSDAAVLGNQAFVQEHLQIYQRFIGKRSLVAPSAPSGQMGRSQYSARSTQRVFGRWGVIHAFIEREKHGLFQENAKDLTNSTKEMRSNCAGPRSEPSAVIEGPVVIEVGNGPTVGLVAQAVGCGRVAHKVSGVAQDGGVIGAKILGKPAVKLG